MNTLSHNKINLAAVGLLLAVAMIRIPVPESQMRVLMRFILEIFISLIVAGYVYHKFNRWVGGLVALIVLSWAISTFRYDIATVQRLTYLYRNAVLLSVVALFVFKYTSEKCLLNCMVAIATANLLFIWMQTIGIDPFNIFTFGLMKSSSAHPTGLMANKNETSALFAFCFFAFWRKRWMPDIENWKYRGMRFRQLLVFVPIAGLILAKSTGGVLSIASMLGFYWFVKNRKAWPMVVIVVGVFLYMYYQDPFASSAITERIRIWNLGDIGIWLNPIFGVGIGLWPIVTKQLHAHNEFIQLWFEVGFIGPLLIFGYAIDVYSRMNQEMIIPSAVLIGVAVNCFVSFPLHVPPTALLVAAWVAILEKKWTGT